MGAGRETYSIIWLAKIPRGLSGLWRRYRKGWIDWKLFREDNLGPIRCFFLEHVVYQPDPNEEEFACKKCHRWVGERRRNLNADI